MKRKLLNPLKKNADKNDESGEEIEMGDISSNLEGYLGCKDDSGKSEGEGSLKKKEGLENAGTEEY